MQHDFRTAFYDKKTGFDRLTDEDKQGIQTYAEGYKNSSTRAKPSVTLCWKSPAWLRARASVPGRVTTRFVRATRSTASTATRGIMLAVIGEKSLAEGVPDRRAPRCAAC